MEDSEETLIKVIEWQQHYGTKIDEIHTCVYGDPTNPDSRGVVARVREMERSFKSIKKAGWIIIASILTGLVSWGFTSLF